MRILIVDADVPEQQLISRILAEAGYRDILCATSIHEAYQRLDVQHSGQGARTVDLVLLDLGLQGITGLQACQTIKSVEALQDLPIVIITGYDKEKLLPAALDAGATDCLSKPIDAIELVSRVRTALKLKQESDARKQSEQICNQTVQSITNAIEQLETILRLVPICPSCSSIADDKGISLAQTLAPYLARNPETRLNFVPCSGCLNHPR